MITPLARSNVTPRTARIFASRRPRKRANSRNGGAAVEVALCLPVLLLVTLLFIEFTNSIFMRQALKLASYEGVRVAIKQGADLDDVEEVCESILDARDVVGYQISVEPTDFSDLPRGTLTTVSIDVDKAQNRLFGMLLGGSETIEIESYALKE